MHLEMCIPLLPKKSPCMWMVAVSLIWVNASPNQTKLKLTDSLILYTNHVIEWKEVFLKDRLSVMPVSVFQVDK